MIALPHCTNNFEISDVAARGVTDARAEDTVISCVISDLSDIPATVVWKDVNDQNIAADDTDNYVVDQGTSSYASGSQTTQLTIKQAKLITLLSPATFKCAVKSGKYPDSDAFETAVTVTNSFGKLFLCYMSSSLIMHEVW